MDGRRHEWDPVVKTPFFPPYRSRIPMKHETQQPVPFEAVLPYDTHLLDLRRFKEVLDYKDIPLFGSLPELLQSLWHSSSGFTAFQGGIGLQRYSPFR